MGDLEFSVLGPLEVLRTGEPVVLGGSKPRALLALLVLHAGKSVRTAVLMDVLWGETPPATAVKTVQKYVSLVRGALGDPALLETRRDGYALVAGPDQVDARRFEQLLDDAAATADAAVAAGLLEDALTLWRGEPFAELGETDVAAAERRRLEERRVDAQDALADAQLALGHHAVMVGRLEELVATHPLREPLWGKLLVALYRSGRQADALAAYERLREILAEQLGIDPSAPLRELHQRILRQDPALDPSGATGPDGHEPVGNLPAPLSSFVGRAAELAELRGLLTDHRLVTLRGTAGAGKTRLGLELASQSAERYRDGAWLVELAPLSAGEQVATAVAAALQLRPQPPVTARRALADYLRGKHMLLVIDNCEHVATSAADVVSDVLGATDEVTVLATSREHLGVAGEVTYEVLPLPVPTAGSPTIGRYDAVQLLVERGRAADPHFELTRGNASAVAQICRRLDGVPLALELAAARLRAFDAEELAIALGDRFSILRSGARTAPARHQTLQAAVDWSHDLLSASEQLLFRRLSVFRGGFEMNHAERVCGTDGLTRRDVRTLLPALVDRSLVVVIRRPTGGTRYRLLETLREYAWMRLVASEEADRIRQRHAQTYLALAEQAEGELHGPQLKTWLQRLDENLDNLRDGLAWCLEAGEPGLALRAGAALWEYWDQRGYVSEGRWLRQALAASSGSEKRVRIAGLVAAGMLAISQADLQAAESFAEQALLLSNKHGDEVGRARSIHIQAQAAQHRGDYPRAEALLTECLALYRSLGAGWAAGWALHHLGMVSRLQGDYERARAFHEESLAVYRQVGERGRTAYSLWMLGVVAQYQGDHQVARTHYQEALTLLEQLEDRTGVAHVRYTLGDLARMEGDNEVAVEMYHQSLARLREVGDERCTASVLRNLGVVALSRSEHDRALNLLGDSLGLRQRLEDKAGVAECLEGFARAAVARGDRQTAVRLLAVAHGLREISGAARAVAEQAEHERLLAELRAALGTSTFDDAWRKGLALTEEQAAVEALAMRHPHRPSRSTGTPTREPYSVQEPS